jgi:hypothetical protein
MLSFQKLDVSLDRIPFSRVGNRRTLLEGQRDARRPVAASCELDPAQHRGGRRTHWQGADMARAYAIVRGSAMECAAALDALALLKVVDARTKERGDRLLKAVVEMLTKMCR